MTPLNWFALIILALCIAAVLAIVDVWWASKRQTRMAEEYRRQAARSRHPMPYEGE